MWPCDCVDCALDCFQFREDNLCLLALISSSLSLISSPQVSTRTMSTQIMHLPIRTVWIPGKQQQTPQNIIATPPEHLSASLWILDSKWASTCRCSFFLINNKCHYLFRYLKNELWWIWNIERAVFCIKPRSLINEFLYKRIFPLCSVPVAGLSWGDVHVSRPRLHVFTPSRGFWGFAEKLFYSETEICKCEISWISFLSFIFAPLNYCWNGFLKAAHDKSFLWLWSFLSKQSSHGSKCEGSQSVFSKILHCT